MQAAMPWLQLLLGMIGLGALASFRPVEVFFVAMCIFLLAYFGIPEVKAFVGANPGIVGTAVASTLIAAIALKLGAVGIVLAIASVGIGAFIVVRDLHAQGLLPTAS